MVCVVQYLNQAPYPFGCRKAPQYHAHLQDGTKASAKNVCGPMDVCGLTVGN